MNENKRVHFLEEPFESRKRKPGKREEEQDGIIKERDPTEFSIFYLFLPFSDKVRSVATCKDIVLFIAWVIVPHCEQ